jgi:hypothetical protein
VGRQPVIQHGVFGDGMAITPGSCTPTSISTTAAPAARSGHSRLDGQSHDRVWRQNASTRSATVAYDPPSDSWSPPKRERQVFAAITSILDRQRNGGVGRHVVGSARGLHLPAVKEYRLAMSSRVSLVALLVVGAGCGPSSSGGAQARSQPKPVVLVPPPNEPEHRAVVSSEQSEPRGGKSFSVGES